jgi:SAM-dependent methyltransferase
MTELSPLKSRQVSKCQICASARLEPILFLGYVPPVNTMPSVGGAPDVEMRFPLEMLRCRDCSLVQIGYEVDQQILFPHTYPYLSGTTRILRDNFRHLSEEATTLLGLKPGDFVIDVGANDGTLLVPFKEKGYKVLGIEPSQAALVAQKAGIDMVKDYFSEATAGRVLKSHGQARLVTAANVFAHIADVHDVVRGVKKLLAPKGVFCNESHYLLGLIETLQYDTVYHEHLRYYSVGSLRNLFKSHDLEIFHVRRIPTHGGSIRVFAAAPGTYPAQPSVAENLASEEKAGINDGRLLGDFRRRVMQSKLDLMELVAGLKRKGARVYGIGAPSRSSTLISYVGLDDSLIDCIMEVTGSHKLDKYMPGTRIPVLDEKKLYEDQPEYALLFSWHIADELMPILRRKGYKGGFIVPLPNPRIVTA